MAEIRLTEEERKVLEGLTPFNISSTVRYTPGAYSHLPEKVRPVFTVRPLRKDESEKLKRTFAAVKTSDETFLREQVRVVISGLDNLYDSATGELIEYKASPDGGMDKDLYGLLPIHITSDILMYVSRISGLIPPEKASLDS